VCAWETDLRSSFKTERGEKTLMKKFIITLAALAIIATTGCGTDSTSPLITYVARASSDSYAPHLFILNATTQQSTAVAIPIPTTAFHVASNRDATKVVYTRYNTTGYDIFLMGKDGVEKQLTTGLDAWAPAFSPDGKTIAFYSYLSSSSSIVTMNLDGSNQTALYGTASGVYAYYPQFSPDGKSVSFFLYVSGCNCASQHRQGAAEEASRLHAQNSHHAVPVHASVGAQIATPTTGWYTMALTDTTPTLAYATTNLWGPAVYSADGKKLLMTILSTNNYYNISSINLDGTGLTPLTTDFTTESVSAVANKNLILFSRYNSTNSSYDIYVMDQTGANQTLVNSTASTTEYLIDSYWGD
jgi:Tol biopolymer transport system component